MRRVPAVIAIVMAMMAALFIQGCAKKAEPVVTSPWPEASTERIVTEPPVPPRWPFTGEDAPSTSAISKRPMSIKIENSSAARPQIGLNSADVVYETVVEGGITRFNCIFHSKIPDVVGPVRSARLSDQWIVPQYDGLLYFSGRSQSVGSVLAKHKIPDLEHGRIPKAYFRVSDRSAPHNLLLDTSKGFDAASDRGHRTTAKVTPLQYDRGRTDATPTVSSVKIPLSSSNVVRWEWDAEKKVFKRENSGRVHRDAETGKQVTADNVVVMWCRYTEATHDMVGSITWDIDMGGEGKVSVFKNGQRFDGTWRADRTHPPVFVAKDGTKLKLSPGRTWFEVAPVDVSITVK